jgi:hypothetical protein
MRTRHLLWLALAVFATDHVRAVTQPAPASVARGADWDSIAKEFLKGHGLADTTPGSVDLDGVLHANFVHSKLGLFEVWFPLAAIEKHGEDFRQCALALVAAQEEWLDWLKPAGKEPKGIREDLRGVSAWVKGWKWAALAKAKNATADDLIQALAASEALTQTHARFAEAMSRCDSLGVRRAVPANARIVLLPTRKDFVELVAFVGWLWPEQRGQYWAEGGADWMQCYLGPDQAIALEYAQVGRKPGDYTSGVPMAERDPTVMAQQVVQLGMNSLLSEVYGERLPAAFAGGLSMNLVIDQFGEINTRVDGDVRAHVTQAREMFVPGGMAEGGMLPQISAESHWRADKGKDRYVHVLRLSQKDGEGVDKKSKNRQACFALRDDKGANPIAVVAPFLGAAAAATPAPPAGYRGDFAELLRAYKCAFIHWLQNDAGANRKASREKFALLLQKLADPDQPSEFEPLLSAVFDKAGLSGPDVDRDTLEGKFLVWLARQK